MPSFTLYRSWATITAPVRKWIRSVLSLAPVKAEIDKSLASAREYMRTYRLLRERAALEEGAKKFRTFLEMEAAYQALLEQRAIHAELHRAYLELNING